MIEIRASLDADDLTALLAGKVVTKDGLTINKVPTTISFTLQDIGFAAILHAVNQSQFHSNVSAQKA